MDKRKEKASEHETNVGSLCHLDLPSCNHPLLLTFWLKMDDIAYFLNN